MVLCTCCLSYPFFKTIKPIFLLQENKICLWHLPKSTEKGKNVLNGDGISSFAKGHVDLDWVDKEPQLVCQENHKGDVTDLKVSLTFLREENFQTFFYLSPSSNLSSIQAGNFTEAAKVIASMSLGTALVPLKYSSRNLQFPHRVPFTKETMPWCPCPFKNQSIQARA